MATTMNFASDMDISPVAVAGEGLEKFVQHVEGLRMVNSNGDSGFDAEYFKLRDKQAEYRQQTPMTAGLSVNNLRKNRYRDIVPYDITRVVLPLEMDDEEKQPVPDSDYINASYIHNWNGTPVAVAAQGPLPHTTGDFWRMIWHSNARIVVMVCNIIESDRYKCAKYWPGLNESETMGELSVTMLSEDEPRPGIRVRRLRIQGPAKQTREVYNFHYTAWPDHGVPETPDTIMHMLALIRDLQPGDDVPIVFHCSAGVGRTGTLLAIDLIWGLLKQHGLYAPTFDVYATVELLRRQRVAMVQTPDQYVFVYMAILDLVKTVLKGLQNDQPAPTMMMESMYVPMSFIREMSKNVPAERRTTLSNYTVPTVEGSLHHRASVRRAPAKAVAEEDDLPPLPADASHSSQAAVSGVNANDANQTRQGQPAGPGQGKRSYEEASAQSNLLSSHRQAEERRLDAQEEDEDEASLAGEERRPWIIDPMRDGPLGMPNRVNKPKGMRPLPAAWKDEYHRTSTHPEHAGWWADLHKKWQGKD